MARLYQTQLFSVN